MQWILKNKKNPIEYEYEWKYPIEKFVHLDEFIFVGTRVSWVLELSTYIIDESQITARTNENFLSFVTCKMFLHFPIIQFMFQKVILHFQLTLVLWPSLPSVKGSGSGTPHIDVLQIVNGFARSICGVLQHKTVQLVKGCMVLVVTRVPLNSKWKVYRSFQFFSQIA